MLVTVDEELDAAVHDKVDKIAELVIYLLISEWMDIHPAPPDYQRSRDMPDWTASIFA